MPERVLTGSGKTVQVFELPFSVPRVEVSMLWHERMQHAGAHEWLRAQLRDIGEALRRKEDAEEGGATLDTDYPGVAGPDGAIWRHL